MNSPSLPSGTITLLFSDIEGSTRLLSRLGDRYADALSAQRSIIRSEVERWGGQEMGTEGDSFFVVFTSASAAAGAALAAQRRLHAHQWPDGVPVRVRMGLHTGTPTPHEDGYVGMDVHRAARIAATASGGQLVISAATAGLLAGGQVDAQVQDLGWHRLKDLPDPEHLAQLVADGLPRDFPPLKSLGTRTNLPLTTGPLVGRDTELAEIADLLGTPDVRLLTLTGPGGSGKTRLAIEAAGLLEAARSDGVYFVPLSTVTTGEVMCSTIGEVLGIPGEGRAPPTFFEHLADRQMLLILDNLEQVGDAGAIVRGVLAAAPGISVLATSRRPLHVAGEYERPVPPLEVPPARTADAATARASGAVALFEQRARMVRSGFELSDDMAGDVVEICTRLDGMPLAIELAAARTKVLSPRALLARLDKSLELSGAASERPSRQRTLRNTIAWSYDLLTPEQQVFFRQLGVFAGGCDLAALDAVVEGKADPLDEVAALVDVSLLTIRDGAGGEPRVGMLQTVRAFAREQLEAVGEWDAAARRHATHYLALADELSPQLRSGQFFAARDRMELELDNIRAALQWSLAAEDAVTRRTEDDLTVGLRLCRRLSWFWYACGYGSEGRRWLEWAVECAAGRETPALMSVLHGLGVLLDQQGESSAAEAIFARCLAYWRRDGDPNQITNELNSLGVARLNLGDVDGSRRLLLEAAEIARAEGTLQPRLAASLSNLGMLETDAGRPEAAVGPLEEALEIDRALGDSWGIACDQVNLVAARLRSGHVQQAYDDLCAVVEHAVSLNDVDLTINVIELFALLREELGDPTRAARLFGTAEMMREQADLPRRPADVAWMEPHLDSCRATMGTAAWDARVEEGRSLSVEAAVAEGTA